MSNFCTAGKFIYFALTIQPTPSDPVEVIQCAPTLAQCYTGMNAAKFITNGYSDVISPAPKIECIKEGDRNAKPWPRS